MAFTLEADVAVSALARLRPARWLMITVAWMLSDLGQPTVILEQILLLFRSRALHLHFHFHLSFRLGLTVVWTIFLGSLDHFVEVNGLILLRLL